jgi:hypothetical protein
VADLSNSFVVVRLTRGRAWIGLLAVLLIGIVALNVVALSFSASSSRAAAAADQLERQNSALRAQIAKELSNGEVQAAALQLGLAIPEPGAIAYLQTSPDDAAEAAKRLRSGDLILGTTTVAPPVTAETTTTVPTVAADPAATVDPATAAATTTTVPATTTTTTPPTTASATTVPATATAPAGGVPAP